jgi:hypothetical protein
MTVEVCCYFWIQSQEVLTDQIMGMKQMLLHLLEDLIILIISILILISKLILSCYFNGRWGTNYFADIIELKTGIKTRLGNASTGNPSTGNPSSVMKMGVDNGNSGIADYNLGLK